MEENSLKTDHSDEDNQPSTSAAATSDLQKNSDEDKTDDEMTRLLQATDEILENKAKSMNLSSLNVRSILHHLIKYPSTIDVLLGIRETDDLPSVRSMRSRKKPEDSGPSSSTNTPKKIAIRIEDRGPKNFLDLEYEEDDEFDVDYVEEGENAQKDADAEESDDEEEIYDEEEDEEEEEEEEEEGEVEQEGICEDGASAAETSANLQNDELHNLLFNENNEHDENYSMNITLNDTRPGSAAMVHTLDNVVDDDDYRNFVHSIKCPNEGDNFEEVYDTEDDMEDEDYNVITDNLNVEDWDETRQDKTTMIPRHEVKALMMDTLLAEKDIPISIFPETMAEEQVRKSQKDRDAEVCERINETVTSSNESCSLLRNEPVTFRPEEIEQLKMQLEQHVQLLTQFVVTCHHDQYLAHVRNSAQLMMNELDDTRQQRMIPTIFDVPNLDNAIETCHDINLFPPVDPLLLRYAKNTDGPAGTVLRPEAAVVLSRSKAIRFPALLPPCQPVYLSNRLTHFLHEEDIMLAIALLQFAHLPRRAEKEILDRYTVIHQNCLPARSPYQIRNHLKSMRRTSKNPVHEIIQAAEQGICNMTVPMRIWQKTDTPIHTWPLVSQPGWYRDFTKIFNVTEDRQIHRKQEAIMVLTPNKNLTPNTKLSTTVSDDYFSLGKGPDGRNIVLDPEYIGVIMEHLKEQSKLTPSKRRKNPTPMKLVQIDSQSEKQLPANEPSSGCAPSTSGFPSSSSSSNSLPKATRRLESTRTIPPASLVTDDFRATTRNSKREMECRPSTSSAYDQYEAATYFEETNLQSCSRAQSSTASNRNTPIHRKPSMDNTSATIGQITSPTPCHQFEYNTNSCSSFPIPPTPGCRSPDELEQDFMDLETNSLMWTRHSFSVTQGNPQTPRVFSPEPDESDPTDFSSIYRMKTPDPDDIIQVALSVACQQPMGYTPQIEESSSSTSYPEAPTSASPSQRNAPDVAMEDDTSMPGLDMVPPDFSEDVEEVVVREVEEEEVQNTNKRSLFSRPPLKFSKEVKAGNMNLKASRKRTRWERETMGSVGLDDEELHENQKERVMRKVIGDINQKLFMHTDTYQRFKKAITDEQTTDIEKVSRVILVLANHPELLNLVLLYAPPEAVISDFDFNTNYQSDKAAIEMIMDIERYITAAKLKEPTIRGLFRYIQSFLDENPDLTDEQATRRFYQLFGQDRPLWKKLESKFWCLPWTQKPRPENFEYVDLTGMEIMTKKEKKDWNNVPPRFETIDDIDQVLNTPWRPHRYDTASNFVVRCGEMCIRKDDETFLQLDIAERHWTRNDDIQLLTAYNEAIKTPNYNDSQIPSFVPDLPFGEKSIVARLQYLLAELKAFEEG